MRRDPNVKHSSVHEAGIDMEEWHAFRVGQRVRTVEGILGTVTAVEDGPIGGIERYIVTLDAGMGGGEYDAGELSAPRTAAKEAADEHFAWSDYPELEDILHDKQPLENHFHEAG